MLDYRRYTVMVSINTVLCKIGLIFILLIFVNIQIYQGAVDIWNTDMQIFLQRCTGVCNKKYCNMSHVCRPINRTSKIKSLDIYFHPGVKFESPLHAELIFYKKFRTEYRQHMIHIKEEFCSLLLYKNSSLFKLADKPLLNRIKNGVYGNFLEPCPLIGHRFLKPRTTNSDDDSFHIPLIPIGEWRMDLKIIKDGEQIFSLSDFYDVRATGARQF